jgi:multimeric flavodoxin WrbA
MKHLLVIYHSQSGNTAQLANAIIQGCRAEAEVDARLCRAFDAGLEDLLWADGLLLGTPENFGTMSGALKDFFDRTYYPAQPHEINLPYALFISAGNDGSGAVCQIDRIASGYPLKKIAPPLIVKGEINRDHLLECKEFGLSMAAGLAMGIF